MAIVTNVEGRFAERRLRALPFAVRCKKCEEVREVSGDYERLTSGRQGGNSLFNNLTA